MYRISYRFLVPGWSAKPLVSAHDRIMGTHRPRSGRVAASPWLPWCWVALDTRPPGGSRHVSCPSLLVARFGVRRWLSGALWVTHAKEASFSAQAR